MDKKTSDGELMKILDADKKTLERFRRIREETIAEAKKISLGKKGKIKILGISGSARDKYDMAQEESNSETLLEECLDYCKRLGSETEFVKLREHKIEPCKACYSTTNAQCHFPCSCYPKGTPSGDDMSNKLYDKILEADAIIFATPVNNFKISSFMALFIDRCISIDGSLSPADKDNPKNRELNIKHTRFIEMNANQEIPGSGFLRRFSGKTAGIIVTGHEEGAALAISSLFMTLNHYGMIFPPWSNVYAITTIANPTYMDKKILLENESYKDELKCLAENLLATAKLTRKLGKQNWKYDYSSN